MQREARVANEPTLDRWRLVGRGVVEHHVDVEASGHRTVDQVQEAAELLGAVAWLMSAMTWPEARSSAA